MPNPSELFLAERDLATAGHRGLRRHGGHAAAAGRDPGAGRAVALGTPRRAVVGWDPSRLSMVLAVLEAACGLRLGQHDVYLNVAGGLRITEPAADLAVAAALVSSLSGVAAAARHGLFRRDRPVRRDPAGGAGAGAAQGGGQARLRAAPSRRAARRQGERPSPGAASIGHIADLVAGIAARPSSGRCRCARAAKGDDGELCGYTRAAPARAAAHGRSASVEALTIMPVSILDLVVIGVVLISALLAAVRGFTREVLAIVAWVAAAAAALVPAPAAPAHRPAIHPQRRPSRSSPRSAASSS